MIIALGSLPTGVLGSKFCGEDEHSGQRMTGRICAFNMQAEPTMICPTQAQPKPNRGRIFSANTRLSNSTSAMDISDLNATRLDFSPVRFPKRIFCILGLL